MPAWVRAGGFAICLAGLALSVPLSSQAGVTAIAPGAQEPAPSGKAMKSSAYQIRCWQHGRLLFEENRVMLPRDIARYGVRIAGTDRNGQPLLVAETTNATCLIRSTVEARGWPSAVPH